MSVPRLIYGVQWLPVESAKQARERLLEGAKPPFASLVLHAGSVTVAARASAAAAGGQSAAAIWAMAIRDGVIIEQLPSGTYWLSVASEGLPLPGFDVEADEMVVRDKLAEALSLGVDATKIYGTVGWDEIPALAGHQKGFEELTAQVADADAAKATFRMFGAGKGLSKGKITLILFLLLVVGGAGAGVWWKHKQDLLRQQEAAARAAAMAANQQRQRVGAVDAKQQALIDQQKAAMRAAWSGTMDVPAATLSLGPWLALPQDIAGYTAQGVAWSTSGVQVNWSASSALSDQRVLQAQAQALGAKMSCDSWAHTCAWSAPVVADRRDADAPPNQPWSLEEDARFARLLRAFGVQTQPAATQSWPLVHLAARALNVTVEAEALPRLLQAVSAFPQVRVSALKSGAGDAPWSISIQIWGAV